MLEIKNKTRIKDKLLNKESENLKRRKFYKTMEHPQDNPYSLNLARQIMNKTGIPQIISLAKDLLPEKRKLFKFQIIEDRTRNLLYHFLDFNKRQGFLRKEVSVQIINVYNVQMNKFEMVASLDLFQVLDMAMLHLHSRYHTQKSVETECIDSIQSLPRQDSHGAELLISFQSGMRVYLELHKELKKRSDIFLSQKDFAETRILKSQLKKPFQRRSEKRGQLKRRIGKRISKQKSNFGKRGWRSRRRFSPRSMSFSFELRYNGRYSVSMVKLLPVYLQDLKPILDDKTMIVMPNDFNLDYDCNNFQNSRRILGGVFFNYRTVESLEMLDQDGRAYICDSKSAEFRRYFLGLY